MTNRELQDRIIGYLAEEDSLEAFQAWFVPAAWDSRNRLAGAVELSLAEYTSGHVREDEFREAMKAVLRETLNEVDPARSFVIRFEFRSGASSTSYPVSTGQVSRTERPNASSYMG